MSSTGTKGDLRTLLGVGVIGTGEKASASGDLEYPVTRLVIPAKAVALFNSEAGQPSALAHQDLEALDPCLRRDD
ncbi:MAG: hypothetical protein WAM90_18295, partial [Rhodanobacter sp.]